jgi:hypothetical protein
VRTTPVGLLVLGGPSLELSECPAGGSRLGCLRLPLSVASAGDLLSQDVAVAGMACELPDHVQVDPSEAHLAQHRVVGDVVELVSHRDLAGPLTGLLELGDNIAKGLVGGDYPTAVAWGRVAVASGR